MPSDKMPADKRRADKVPNSKNDCICRVVREAARSLTNAYDKALAPSGLRTTQFTLLSVLSHRPAATVTELSEFLEIDQTTTTRNLSILEEAGLVVRVPHHDPRVKLVKLSAKGKQRRRKAVKHWLAIQSQIKAAVPEQDWKTFGKVLNAINARLEQLDKEETK